MKKIAALITAAALSGGLMTTVYAENTEKVVVSIEKMTLGAGYVLEPTLVTIPENASVSEALQTAMEAAGIDYDGYAADGVVSYYTAIQDNDQEIDIPEQIVTAIESEGGTINYTRNREGYLSENDYYQGGWMYIVNNQSAMVGSNEYNPEDGDVIQLYFSVYGWGADYGFGWSGNVAGVEYADKCALMKKVAEMKAENSEEQLESNEAYKAALEVISTYGVSQESVDNAMTSLSVDNVAEAYKSTGEYLSSLTPAHGSEWSILGLSRGDYDFRDEANKEFYDTYYNSVVSKVVEAEGNISASSTDYSRTIIGLTAIGKDATNVAGYNIVEKISDIAPIEKQGLNGAVYALLALDTVGYEPVDMGENTVTKEKLVDAILSAKLEGGGWTFWGSVPDADMTSMASTALAPYYDTNPDVKAAIDEALMWLSTNQCESGGYASYGSENPETAAQVLVMLTTLGIDPDTDDRFIKNGNTIAQAISEYVVEGGGFAHSMGGAVNLMATQQSYYALTAYYRFKDGKTSLYDMTDVKAVADISVRTENGAVIYTNNGTGDANALSIIAYYNDEGRLEKTDIKTVEIKAGIEYMLEAADNNFKAFLWNDMMPLCVVIGD